MGANNLCSDHFGTDGFGDVMKDRDPRWEEKIQKENAVDAMIRLVTENPNQVKERSAVCVCGRVWALSEGLPAGLPGGPRPTHQPGPGSQTGSGLSTETQRAVHYGGQHGRWGTISKLGFLKHPNVTNQLFICRNRKCDTMRRV